MNSTPRILVVENDRSERDLLTQLLRRQEYHVLEASSAEQAMQALDGSVDIVVCSLHLGRQGGGQYGGMAVLRSWKEKHPQVSFLILAWQHEADVAVNAIKLGADEYLLKPSGSDTLLRMINRLLESARNRLRRSVSSQRNPLAPPTREARAGFEKIVARSQVMHEVFDQAQRAAQTDSTVLIMGESGTGKELIAEAIHENSPRKDCPFVTVNMAAIPQGLVESELFGHVAGAFTGATSDRVGRFEAADRGTLFIDEIGDFELSSQAKLLRVLENHTILPVGGNNDRKVDVRVVAATSCDLRKMLQERSFRKDLFYRLNVLSISLAPLRDRREDIRLLVQTFMEEICRENQRPRLTIDGELMQFLESFDWPGNVRQLRNCVESMVVMADDDVLTMDDLPSHLNTWNGSPEGELYVPIHTTLENLERSAIIQSLEHFEGNRTRTAHSLGISVRTLQRRLKAWGFDRHDGSDPSYQPGEEAKRSSH